IFDRIDFSNDSARETRLFLGFTLRRLLGWLTALDQAFGQSPRFSIVRLNERDFRVSILHSIYNASRGNLSSRHQSRQPRAFALAEARELRPKRDSKLC